MKPYIEPSGDGLSAIYWNGARDRLLLLQQCAECANVWHPPATMCTSCMSGRYEWCAAKGGGKLHTYTVVHHAAHPLMTAWLPYNIALVELDEGPRVVTTIRGCDLSELHIGMRLILGFEVLGPNLQLPVFFPSSE